MKRKYDYICRIKVWVQVSSPSEGFTPFLVLEVFFKSQILYILTQLFSYPGEQQSCATFTFANIKLPPHLS